MKHFFFAVVLSLSLYGYAQDSNTQNRVCQKDSPDAHAMIESCQLGLRVLQGLYVAQDQGRFPSDVEIQPLEDALRSGRVQIQTPSEFSQLDQEKKADYLYKQMMKASGQSLPILKRPNIPQSGGKNGAHMSTGTRGGGFDPNGGTSLTEDLWY